MKLALDAWYEAWGRAGGAEAANREEAVDAVEAVREAARRELHEGHGGPEPGVSEG